MQIPILNGVLTDNTSNFRNSYPRNLMPVPKNQGISQGYLKQAEGIELFSAGLDIDRGGVAWLGECYRSQGTKLIKVSSAGVVATIGDIGAGTIATDLSTFDYSADFLGISSGGRLWLYDGTTLTQNTDPDLGTVLDFVWLDGYFITTDGEFLVVTELDNPFAVNPFKYGSSEIDPDPINGVHELRNELVAVNRHSIEFFRNIGGVEFPFDRISGAQIAKGSIGTYASTIFNGKVAFVGGGRNEPPGVYLAANGGWQKVSTAEIDEILKEYSELQLSKIFVEARIDKSHAFLYIKLPDKTLVFDANATALLSRPVWFTLSAGVEIEISYPAHGFLWCYDEWLSADPLTGKLGKMVDNVSTHYGEEIKWQFGTDIIYNEGRGVIIHSLELVCLTGSAALGADPVVTMEHSIDGLTWSQPIPTPAGKQGDRNIRVEWRKLGRFEQFQIQRFSGSSDTHIAIARLQAKLQGLRS